MAVRWEGKEQTGGGCCDDAGWMVNRQGMQETSSRDYEWMRRSRATTEGGKEEKWAVGCGV